MGKSLGYKRAQYLAAVISVVTFVTGAGSLSHLKSWISEIFSISHNPVSTNQNTTERQSLEAPSPNISASMESSPSSTRVIKENPTVLSTAWWKVTVHNSETNQVLNIVYSETAKDTAEIVTRFFAKSPGYLVDQPKSISAPTDEPTAPHCILYNQRFYKQAMLFKNALISQVPLKDKVDNNKIIPEIVISK